MGFGSFEYLWCAVLLSQGMPFSRFHSVQVGDRFLYLFVFIMMSTEDIVCSKHIYFQSTDKMFIRARYVGLSSELHFLSEI